MQHDRLDRICEELPLFPLPRLVLMPREILPLHVFEPRYRALLVHCMSLHRVMGVATIREGDPAGDPPLHDIVGVGLIVAHQALADGRSNIVLQSIGRARIEAELDRATPFRIARATLLVDQPDIDDSPTLRALLRQLGAARPGSAEEAKRLGELGLDELVDELARRVLDAPEQRLDYLRLDRLSERARMLEGRLAELVAYGREPVGEA